ncbi:MAG: diacylglyceryl transferase [Chitinophagaceae bacterium]|nr:MAG: diacylglyceryl transferase [Chitinophagaceae bacterium]
MFDKLKQKWKVGSFQLTLILITFAIGGSCTGWAAKALMNQLSISQDWLWGAVYCILLTLIWPMMVILVSFPLGQFRFFTNYTRRLAEKMGLLKKKS